MPTGRPGFGSVPSNRGRDGGTKYLLGRYLLPVLGRMPVDTITPSVVRTWWSRLLADKPTVRARSYALLKAVMNTAVADEVVDSNPCRIRGAANTPRAREIRPATLDELEVIVEAMPERLRALVLLCAWCALRSGDVLELRRKDVDVERGTVRVVRAVLGRRRAHRRNPEVGSGHEGGLHPSAHRPRDRPPPRHHDGARSRSAPLPGARRGLEPAAVDDAPALADRP